MNDFNGFRRFPSAAPSVSARDRPGMPDGALRPLRNGIAGRCLVVEELMCRSARGVRLVDGRQPVSGRLARPTGVEGPVRLFAKVRLVEHGR